MGYFNKLKVWANAFLLVVAGTNAMAATYYVATTGDNANNGTTPETAFKTINFAVNLPSLTGGDTVFVMAGTYNERVIITKSGTIDNRITVKNYSNDLPVIDGTGKPYTVVYHDGLVQIEGSYINFDGFKVINSKAGDDATGILIKGPGIKQVTISNCITDKSSNAGIGVWGNKNVFGDYSGASDIIIENCKVTKNGFGKKVYIDNIIIAEGVENFTIRNCETYSPEINWNENQFSTGINMKSNVRNGKVYGNKVHDLLQSNGIVVWTEGSNNNNIEIFGNTLYNIGTYGISLNSISEGLVYKIKVYNNLMYHINWDVLKIDGGKKSGQVEPSDISIYNNTFANSNMGSVLIYSSDINAEIRNNIFVGNLWNNGVYTFSANKPNLKVDNNLISENLGRSFTTPLSEELSGTNVIITKEVNFVNEQTANFHLKSNSPAIDKSESTLVAQFDLDGKARTVGTKADLGAFEYEFDETKVNGIALDSSKYTMLINLSKSITATVLPNTAVNKNIVWFSSNPNVAAVIDGTVKAIGEGYTVVTVKTEENQFSDSAVITVVAGDDGKGISVAGISSLPEKASISLYQSFPLSASFMPDTASNTFTTWESLNPDIASVNSKGVVTGVTAGTASIVCTSTEGNKKDTTLITVINNMLLNPGFEEDLNIGWGWHFGYDAQLTTVKKKTGKYGLQVGPGPANRTQSVTAGIEAGKHYVLTAWACQDGAWVYDWYPVMSILVKCYKSGSNTVLREFKSIPINNKILNFKQLSIDFTTPANTDSVVIDLNTIGGAQTPTYYYDDFVLVPYIPNSVNEVEGIEGSLSVYPNPVSSNGILTVETNGIVGKKNITILDITGKVLFNKIVTGPVNEIDISSADLKGFYILKVSTNTQTAAQKLIVN